MQCPEYAAWWESNLERLNDLLVSKITASHFIPLGTEIAEVGVLCLTGSRYQMQGGTLHQCAMAYDGSRGTYRF